MEKLNIFASYFEFLERIARSNAFVVFCILIALVVGILIGRILNWSSGKKIRTDAVKRSKAVINGQIMEQIMPYLPDFPCNPGDVRFIGKPVDYIGFIGATEKDEISEILFIECKTGGSKLSARERQIKNAVDSKKVRYVVYEK